MKKNPWFRFLILQCCAVTVSVSQLKVSAVMEQVAQGFSISMGAAAGLMSFFTVAGIVLAIPGAAFWRKRPEIPAAWPWPGPWEPLLPDSPC